MYDHILVPTDGGTASKRAAKEAVRLAEAHDARLTILTVIDDVDTGSHDGVELDDLEQSLQNEQRGTGASEIEETLAELGETPVQVETQMVSGVPHRAICDYVESTDFDLVVMGQSGRSSLAEYLLGSTTDKVTRLCGVPVVVV